MKSLILIMTALMSTVALASDYEKSMDSLGGNRDLIRRARAMDPDNKVQVVQNRIVDLNTRFEFGINYGIVAGGDPYLNTQGLGAMAEFHIDPRWSIGARYVSFFNNLTSEGNRVASDFQTRAANQQPGAVVPAINSPLSTVFGTISFSPFYGKLNMFDLGVAQFDVYVLAGYGTVQTSSSSSGTYTAGGGVALWLSQHLSSRFEVRYQGYQDQIDSGSRNINDVIIQAGIGFLL